MNKNQLLAVALVAGLNALLFMLELLSELWPEPTWLLIVEEMFEITSFLFSLLMLGYLFYENQRRQTAIQLLQTNLSNAKAELNQANLRLKQAGQAYHEAMREQFEAWQFTPSEQAVAVFLVKGLSFKEIAEARQTQEKTVRQQATAIYNKSNLKGRHEFAAYFFENFLL